MVAISGDDDAHLQTVPTEDDLILDNDSTLSDSAGGTEDPEAADIMGQVLRGLIDPKSLRFEFITTEWTRYIIASCARRFFLMKKVNLGVRKVAAKAATSGVPSPGAT